jgi:hypothetical protein
MGNCSDCHENKGCDEVSGIEWDAAVSSCLSSLGVVEGEPLATVVTKVAAKVCDVKDTAVFGICVQNTAFVTPCGDDATAEVGSLTKMFKTIKGAVAAVDSSGTKAIYVFPGTYNEYAIHIGSDSVVKNNIKIWLSLGATIDAGAGQSIIDNTSNSLNIVIGGYGVLTSQYRTLAAMSSVNAANYDITAQVIKSTGLDTLSHAMAFQNGTFKITFRECTTTGASCLDVRNYTTTGYITGDVMDNTASVSRSPAARFGTGTHRWICNVKKTTSNPNSVNAGVFVISGGSAIVEWNGDVSVTSSDSPGSYCSAVGCNRGQLTVNGEVTSSGCHGAVNVGGFLVLNGRVRTTGDYSAIRCDNPPGDGIIICNANVANNSSVAATVSFSNATAGWIQLNNAVVRNDSTVSGNRVIEMANSSQSLILKNAYLVSGSSSGIALYTSGASTARITGSYSNVPASGSFTYPIESLTVDSDLIAFVEL